MAGEMMGATVMRLGLSRSVEELAGDPGAPLTQWREWGISVIELRRVDEETPPEEVARAARRVWSAGLALAVHARLPKEAVGATLGELFPGLSGVLRELRERGEAVVVPVHAYAAQAESESRLAARTREALRRAVDAAEREGVPLRFAVELNRAKGPADPSVTYEGVLALVEGLPAGICWDFGHGCSNTRRGLLAATPPAAFLDAVTHTHIHDIGPGGDTHWPLTQGVVPVSQYVERLLSAGYEGILNLELSEERYAGQVDPAEGLRASIERLRECVKRANRC